MWVYWFQIGTKINCFVTRANTKFGIAQVKTKDDPSVASIISPGNKKKGATLGLGAKYDFDDSWTGRAEVDTFDTGRNDLGRIPVYSLD